MFLSGSQPRRGGQIEIAGNVVRAVLAATVLVLLSAWLALPSPAAAQTQFPLTVTLAGGGIGSVEDTSLNISCPTRCSASFDQGSQVALTASPDDGSTFVGWSGAGCSGTQSCIVTMNSAEDVTATFAVTPPPPPQYTLNVHLAGGGVGSVQDTSFNISCPTRCSSVFGPGAEVVLVASADDVSTFVGWSGAGCSGTQSCIVTMNSNQSVTATFLQPGHGTFTVPVPKPPATPPDPIEDHHGLALGRPPHTAHQDVVLQVAQCGQDPRHLPGQAVPVQDSQRHCATRQSV